MVYRPAAGGAEVILLDSAAAAAREEVGVLVYLTSYLSAAVRQNQLVPS